MGRVEGAINTEPKLSWLDMDTLTMFPEKIRAFILDNDARFLRSCSAVLPILNYKVTTCRKPVPTALTLLLGSQPKNVDVLLIEAEKAATCGFDFRGIVEPYLSIPVIYYYHENTGDRVNMIRRRLGSGTYTIRRPLNVADVHNLWRVIAWRKSCLVGVNNPNLQASHNPVPFPSTAALGSDGRGLKRRNSDDPGSSSSSSSSGGGSDLHQAGDHSTMGQQQMNVIQGQQRFNWLASQQQQERRGMEAARENNGKGLMSQQAQAMDARQKLRQSVMQSVLHALDMPQPSNPSRPSNFAGAARPSNNVAAACAGASNTAAAGPPSLPVYPPAPAPAPAPVPPLPPVNRRQFPAQAPPPLHPTPPPARTATPVYPAAPAPSPHYLFPPRSKGTGPIMLNFQQTQAGDPSTGMSTGAATTAFGAPAIAQTGAYNGNAASSSLIHDQSLNPAGADDQNELSAMVTMYTDPNPNPNPPVAPQHVGDGPNEAAMATLYNNNNTNYNAAGSLAAPPPPQHVSHDTAALAALEAALNSGDDDDFSNLGTGSHMAPDQVLGMASYMNELTIMAGRGASGGGNGNDVAAAPPNGGTHVVAPGAMLDDGDIFESLMGPLVGPGGAAMDGDGTFETMFPDTGDDFTFPLEDIMGLSDDDGQNDGSGANATTGANTATDDVAETSQIGGNFVFPRDNMNNGRE